MPKHQNQPQKKGIAYDVFENYKFRKEQSWNFQFEKKVNDQDLTIHRLTTITCEMLKDSMHSIY